MTNELLIGTMLIAKGTWVPRSLTVGITPYTTGWSEVTTCTSAQLGRDIEKAGWTLLFMAGEIHANGYGSSDEVRLGRAVDRVIQTVGKEKCNCLEITEIKHRSFLGIRYTSIGAHARHIQQSRSFYPLAGDSKASVEAQSRLISGEAIQNSENEGGLRAEAIQLA